MVQTGFSKRQYRSQDLQSILGCAARSSLHVAEAHHSSAQHISCQSPSRRAAGVSHNRLSRDCHSLDAHVGVQSSVFTSTWPIPYSVYKNAILGPEDPVSL